MFSPGQFYKQMGGVALASKMGPNYACLFLGFMDKSGGNRPVSYLNSIGDASMTWSVSHDVAVCNWRITSTSYQTFILLSYLGAKSLTPNSLSWTFSYAPQMTADTHSYLHHQSAYPYHCLPLGLPLRLRRLCSDDYVCLTWVPC